MITRSRRWRYVIEDRDRHGNVRVYLRRPGMPKVRLQETPGTDAFEAEYRRAIGSPAPAPRKRLVPPAAGTLHALCVAYYGSAEFKQLDPRSQRVRRLILDRFCGEHGTKPAARLEPRHLFRIRDAKAETPEAANGLLKALRAVYKAAVARGLAPSNPAAAVPYLASKNPEGIHSWTLEEVAQYEAHHPVGTKARLALALMLYTGQRRSDVVLFGRQHVRDGWLHFTQQKGRNRRPVRLSLPIVPELRRIIDATPIGDLAFLVTERGHPFGVDSFGNRFRAWCRDAGLPQCSTHGLRKATSARLAELGCSANEIAAVTGHRTLKEVARYTAAASQKLMAESALARLGSPGLQAKVSHPDRPGSRWDESSDQAVDQKGKSSEWCPGKGR